MARSTISRGIKELSAGDLPEPERTRRSGGGRKRAVEKDTTLLADLDALVEPTTSGAPDAPLRWTSKSVRKLTAELQVKVALAEAFVGTPVAPFTGVVDVT